MARKPRIEYPGAFYHVISRGNRKQTIFKDDKDRKRVLQKLLEYKETYSFILYAYTLMDNHIHLLIEVGKVPLSKIMQCLLQSYTQWYNVKYDLVGHLFQGRYKSILCDKNVYLLNLIRYIHLNCVRAGIVSDPADYKWSSHRIYLGLEESKLIDPDLVLKQFSNRSRKKAIKLFDKFVMEWIGEDRKDEFYRTIDQRILGEENFVRDVKKKVGEEFKKAEDILRDKTLEDIASAVNQLSDVTTGVLRSRSRSSEALYARKLFVYLSLTYTQSKRKEIAEYLDRTPKMVSYLERKIDKKKMNSIKRKLVW
jgi:putative transposase